VQQPTIPAITSLSRSCLIKRRLTTFDLRANGAASLPAFLITYGTGVAGPLAIFLFSGAECRKSRNVIVAARGEPFISHRFERQLEKSSVRLSRGKFGAGQEFTEKDVITSLPLYAFGGDRVNGTPTTRFTLPFTPSFTLQAM
jgi:hypothetical protein